MDDISLNNGHIIEVTPDMFEKVADDFSEGNSVLKELLLFCFRNNIKTTGCCSGHNGEKRPYIQLEFSDKNMQAILKILKKISLEDAIKNLTFIRQPGVTSNFCISMQNDRCNEGFAQVLEALQYEKKIEISDLDENRQLIVNSVKNHNVSNSYLELQEEESSISIGLGDEYLTVLLSEKETIPWTEETQLAEYSKDSSDLSKTLHRLESRTKNIKYLNDHPLDSQNISNIWKDKDNIKTIEMNPSATMERQYEYGERNVAVIDVLPGSSIESVANEIMQLNQYGQACITRFNSFVIDSRDYQNTDEIINAYMKEYEKHRLERENKTNNVTIEKVRDATGDVKISDINNETGEIKQAVKEEQQPRVELDSQNVEPEL